MTVTPYTVDAQCILVTSWACFGTPFLQCITPCLNRKGYSSASAETVWVPHSLALQIEGEFNALTDGCFVVVVCCVVLYFFLEFYERYNIAIHIFCLFICLYLCLYSGWGACMCQGMHMKGRGHCSVVGFLCPLGNPRIKLISSG